MIKKNLKCAVYLTLLLVTCNAGQVLSQMPIRTSPAPYDEIKKAYAAVEANPDSLKAHKIYIYAMGLNNPFLIPQYNVWMDKYPKNVNIPLAIGTVYYNAEMPQAKEFLQKAAEMEPKNAKVWFMLSADAGMRGQNELSTEYMKKAALAEPLNANYAFCYLTSSKDSNPNDYKQKVFDFVKHFPTSVCSSQALYWLGEDARTLSDKITYFEDLRKLYPPQKFDWSSSGMIGLADAYLQTDPEKALALTNEMGDEKKCKTENSQKRKNFMVTSTIMVRDSMIL